MIHPQKCPHSRRGFLLFFNYTGGSPHTPTGLKGLFSLPFFSTFPSPSENPSGLCPTWGKAGLGENPPCSAKSFPQIGKSPWGHLGMSLVKQRAGLRDAPWGEEHCPGLLGCVTPLCWCDKLIPFSFPLSDTFQPLIHNQLMMKLICSLMSPQRTSFPIPLPVLWGQRSGCPWPSVGVTWMSLPMAAPIGNTQPKVLEQPPPGSVQTPQALLWGLGDNLWGQDQSHISHLSWPD